MTTDTAPAGRLTHLDGLRGIAALIVILQHAAQVVAEAGFGLFGPMLDAVNLGRFGVILFFLISGFVIPFSFRGPTPLRDFAISRFFRLYPAFWLSIPILAIVAATKGRAPDLPTFLANITMVQEWFGYANIGWGYWTLSYEMGFYLLCMLLFAGGALASARANALLLAAMIALTLLPFMRAGLGLDAGPIVEKWYFIAMFLAGMLLRRVVVEGSAEARRWATVLLPLLFGAGLLMGGLWLPVPSNGSIYFKPIALATSMALPLPLFYAVLRWRPQPGPLLIWFGTISYSLYLFQDVGLHLLPFLLPPGDAPLLFFAAVFAVTIAIAALVYRFVEAPMIAAGRRLTRRAPGLRAAEIAP